MACEKPLAGTLADTRAMKEVARRAKGKTFVWFNYRRCPAVGLAWGLVKQGALGTLHHVRAHYLQSWGCKETPLLWRFRKAQAGSGAHGISTPHHHSCAISGRKSRGLGDRLKTFITRRRVQGRRTDEDRDDAALSSTSPRCRAVRWRALNAPGWRPATSMTTPSSSTATEEVCDFHLRR
jgi:predicted dehydrogenase